MSNKFEQFKGKWITIANSKFRCTGKIEDYNENIIILSSYKFDVDKLITTYVGIDVHLIEKLDFIDPPNENNKFSLSTESSTPKVLNVFTSEIQPPSIKRGGSSSAVSRNLIRQNPSQEKITKIKNSSFSDFGSRSRKSSIGNKNHEPSWLNYNPGDMETDFDFDKHLAFFDKDGLTSSTNKFSNDGSDSNDSVGIKMNFDSKYKKSRNNTINFDTDDFPSYDEDHGKSINSHSKRSTASVWDFSTNSEKKNIFNELQQIGVIPCQSSSLHTVAQNSSRKYFQQPDLVREITQQQLNNNLKCNNDRFSVVSLNKHTTEFSEFTEFWNLDNRFIFPVFTIKQRDLLFEIASQLGFGSSIIENIVGDILFDFVIKQVGGLSRINTSNVNQSPKIAILISKCNASVYAISAAGYLLRSGCHIIVFMDDNKTSDINYKIDSEISRLNKLFPDNISMTDYNFITYKIQDLTNKTFDYVISGVESDSCDNHPSAQLIAWCQNQKSPILCINPPSTSNLMWKSAIFIGVPTSSYSNLSILIDNNVVCCNNSRKISFNKTAKKPDGMILLCNINFPGKVFSFLSLNYRSLFTDKKWLRLYNDSNDLCLVE